MSSAPQSDPSPSAQQAGGPHDAATASAAATAATPEPIAKDRSSLTTRQVGQALAIALVAAALTLCVFAPPVYLWRGLNWPTVREMAEFGRGRVTLSQVDDPWARVEQPLHLVANWRLLFPMLWHYAHLPRQWVLAIPQVGCVLALWLVAGLSLKRMRDWGQTLLTTMLCAALPWFFVSTGWLGYFDSWLVLGLTAAAFVPSPWVLGITCLAVPWIDERFLLALPLALLVRQVALERAAERRWSVTARELAIAAAACAPYVIARLAYWLHGDLASTVYVQAHLQAAQQVPWSRYVAGLWSGYRAGWLAIATSVVLCGRRTGWNWGLLLALAAVTTSVGGLFIAADLSRTQMMIFPLLLLGIWLWCDRCPADWWWVLPSVVLANFVLPATHEVWLSQVAVRRLPAEWQSWRDPANPLFVAAELVDEAQALTAQGDAAGAEAKLDAALEQDNRYVMAYTQRIALRLLRNDVRGAETDAAIALHLEPTNTFALFSRGLIRAQRGDNASAVKDLRLALAYSRPDWPWREKAEETLRQLLASPSPTLPPP